MDRKEFALHSSLGHLQLRVLHSRREAHRLPLPQ
jgi:hypothetical protein